MVRSMWARSTPSLASAASRSQVGAGLFSVNGIARWREVSRAKTAAATVEATAAAAPPVFT